MIEETSYGIILKLKGSDPARFLVVHQTKGHWSFPKGHKENEETIEETVRRELFEETGITDVVFTSIEPISEPPYTFEHEGAKIHKTNHYIFGETESEDVTPQQGETTEIRFATRDELKELMTLPGQQDFLEVVATTCNENEQQ
jgi:bis(5'-nucleosidyl)-tetraphosphatase